MLCQQNLPVCNNLTSVIELELVTKTIEETDVAYVKFIQQTDTDV